MFVLEHKSLLYCAETKLGPLELCEVFRGKKADEGSAGFFEVGAVYVAVIDTGDALTESNVLSTDRSGTARDVFEIENPGGATKRIVGAITLTGANTIGSGVDVFWSAFLRVSEGNSSIKRDGRIGEPLKLSKRTKLGNAKIQCKYNCQG